MGFTPAFARKEARCRIILAGVTNEREVCNRKPRQLEDHCLHSGKMWRGSVTIEKMVRSRRLELP